MKEGIRDSIGKPVNDSKGCGGLMRMAPAAFLESWDYPCQPSQAGAEIASMTHGHPLGIICAAAFVRMLEELLCGRDLRYALDMGITCAEVDFRGWGELKEFKEIMDKAVSLSQSTLTDQEAIGNTPRQASLVEAAIRKILCGGCDAAATGRSS